MYSSSIHIYFIDIWFTLNFINKYSDIFIKKRTYFLIKEHISHVKNYTYIYLINVYHTLTYISLIYMKFLKVLVCYMKYYQKINKQ
jgi:hypothetical protein